MYKVAGFNRSTKNYLHKDWILATSGLANCMAVVAINDITGLASISHYDTLHALLTEHDAWVANMKALGGFKKWIDRRTAPTRYLVGIGSIWFDTASNQHTSGGKKQMEMRHQLLLGIKSTFRYEPIIASACIAFDGGVLKDFDKNKIENLAGWANEGDLIPYDDFR